MYVYTKDDQKIIEERAAQYKDQSRRYFAGELTEEEFLPLRLQNGLYVQRHAPMLRVAIPYGLLNTRQVRTLADIARKYDKGYLHVSTRQNVQFNWPLLESIPDILEELAAVQMHAIQTSGNCIRNTTTDPYAGAIADEPVDPRPYCEIIRQWSTLHPEFAYLPRKFKIAVSSATDDRAAIRAHDIGIRLTTDTTGAVGYQIFVGGGLGRTPVIAQEICAFLPEQHLLSYLEAILRVYNRYGRRDNKYKARIKILVRATGIEAFREMVESEWKHLKNTDLRLPSKEIERTKGFFQDPAFENLEDNPPELASTRRQNPAFENWVSHNCVKHKQPGYMIVNLSVKQVGAAPGDISAEQMNAVADLADQYSMGEVRTTHDQNLVLAHVKQGDLLSLWKKLDKLGLATANIGFLTDVICCPGGDFCALANAKSIPIAEQIQERFEDLDYLYDLGKIDLNISGCMNACGHHHIGHIGILGVDKKGEEFYQISLGGHSGNDASLGKIIGPSFYETEVTDVIEKIINIYLEKRIDGETFLTTYRRIGMAPFKERVYAKAD